MEKIKKVDFVKKLAEKAGLSDKAITAILTKEKEVIEELTAEKVLIPTSIFGLGTKIIDVKEREYFDPKDTERVPGTGIVHPAHESVKPTISKSLKDCLK